MSDSREDVLTPAPATAEEAPAAEPAAETPAAEQPSDPASAPAAEPPPAAEAVPLPGPPPAPGATPAADDPWGRVGEDGTVYVRTADGERAVGSWQAGSPAEALEFYRRRYDGIVVEVDLLEQRIRETDVPPKEATAAIARLRESLAEAAAVGDLGALGVRVTELEALARARSEQIRAAKAEVTAATRVLKERIIADAEKVGASTDWRVGGDRLSALLDEWKAAPRLDRRSDDELWRRFSAARTSFAKRRKVHYAELTQTRDAARAAKEALVARAEELAASTDWGATSTAYRALMQEWKDSGRAKREVDDELWARFRGAQDTFFAARNAAFAERDSERSASLAAKQALLAEAERLVPVTDARSARAVLRGIGERWEAAGHVPREDRGRIEARLAAVESAVREAEESLAKRTNPTARARAAETVAALEASIASFESKAAKARDAGNEKKATEADESAAARREWLVEAQRTLAEFS